MKNDNIYKSWRDKLLSVISEEICITCADEQKIQHDLNFDDPLKCGCHCNRVEIILEYAKKIDEDIKKYSEKNKG